MVLLASAVLVLGFFAGSRRLASTALFAAVLLGVGVGWLETVNVLDYHTVSLWGPPPKVDWCGRTYLLGGSPVHVPAPLGRLDARWVVVVVTPSGTRLESGVGCGSPRTATLLRAPAGPGTWYLYGLSGGP